jgi:hypothetical protein
MCAGSSEMFGCDQEEQPVFRARAKKQMHNRQGDIDWSAVLRQNTR